MSDDVAQQVALRSFDTVPECPFDQLSNREMQITLMVVELPKGAADLARLCISARRP